MFKWNNFSGSLLVRSVYLITLPIVLVQVVGIIIFFELHWDLVLKRSAQSIANEIKILELNKDNEEIDKFAHTLQIIKTDKIQINEPIMITNLMSKMDSIEGVQSVVDIDVTNLYNTNDGYSGNLYDIDQATKNRVIYPSLDPSIFEVKYPNKDIRGRVVTL